MLCAYLRGLLPRKVTGALQIARERVLLESIEREQAASHLNSWASVLSPFAPILEHSTLNKFMDSQQEKVFKASRLMRMQPSEDADKQQSTLDINLEKLYNAIHSNDNLFKSIYREDIAARDAELREIRESG